MRPQRDVQLQVFLFHQPKAKQNGPTEVHMRCLGIIHKVFEYESLGNVSCRNIPWVVYSSKHQL